MLPFHRFLPSIVEHSNAAAKEPFWESAICYPVGAAVQVELYENMDECWVVKVALETVDSPHGLAAYASVLLRNDDRVRAYRLTKVVQHWNITPGDGNVYFACMLLPYHVLKLPWCNGALHAVYQFVRTVVPMGPHECSSITNSPTTRNSCRVFVTWSHAHYV
jgi:hypothetical protein